MAGRPSKLAEMADMVRDRDGCCKICGSTEGLHAARLVPARVKPEIAWYAPNWITLCEKHHRDHKERNRAPRIRKPRGSPKNPRGPQRRTLLRVLEYKKLVGE